MGIIILLKFSLLCVDLLAWPAIALGYPLFASIKAIETGSNYHMKKLVIYWTLFSLFSLFEFAFAKIIEWIPFWSSVRFLVILWLVMPQFDGACHAYQVLVRPILLVKLQAFIERFYKLKKERLFKRETFLDVVEKYIKENGSEVLEKLIALEHESQNCINFQRDAEILEPRGQNAAATLKQLNEPKAAPRDTKMLEVTEKSAATKTQRVQYSKSVSSAWVVKDTTPLEARENRRSETPPLKQTQLEWACDICKVEAMSEIMLNAHLQGSKHMSKLESLKARMIDAKDTEPSHSDKMQKETVEVKEIIPPKETAEKRCPETPPLKKAQQDWTCDLCKVTTTSEMDLNAHLHGIKHMFKLETTKACNLGAKYTGPSPSATSELNHCNVAEKCVKESASGLVTLTARKNEHEGCNSSHRDIRVVDSGEKQGSTTSQKVQGQGQNAQSIKAVWVPKGKDVNAEVKEMAPPEESAQNRRVETPPLKKAQQEQTSDLCKDTAPSENLLSANHQGCKNKPKFESLKWSKIPSKDTGISPSSTCKVNHGNLVGAEHKDGEGSVKKYSEKQIYKHWCTVCDVKLISDIDWASHLKGKRHSSNF